MHVLLKHVVPMYEWFWEGDTIETEMSGAQFRNE